MSKIKKRAVKPNYELFVDDFAVIIVNRGDWLARQTSKEQTKMPRFMLEGPRPRTIFCFQLIHYA